MGSPISLRARAGPIPPLALPKSGWVEHDHRRRRGGGAPLWIPQPRKAPTPSIWVALTKAAQILEGVPVLYRTTKFVTSFYGGKKGLIENLVSLCQGTHQGEVDLKVQNGGLSRARHGTS